MPPHRGGGERVRREEWAGIRRREMLASYYEVPLDEGLQGASLAKIAKRVQAPPSLLIHYFGTKEQMTIELLDYLLERYHDTYGALFEGMADPLERLRTIVDYLFSVEYQQLMDDRAFYALFYVSLTTHPAVPCGARSRGSAKSRCGWWRAPSAPA